MAIKPPISDEELVKQLIKVSEEIAPTLEVSRKIESTFTLKFKAAYLIALVREDMHKKGVAMPTGIEIQFNDEDGFTQLHDRSTDMSIMWNEERAE